MKFKKTCMVVSLVIPMIPPQTFVLSFFFDGGEFNDVSWTGLEMKIGAKN